MVPEFLQQIPEFREEAPHVPLDDAHEVDQLPKDELLQLLLACPQHREQHGKRAGQVAYGAKLEIFEDEEQSRDDFLMVGGHFGITELLEKGVNRDLWVKVVRVRHEANGGKGIENTIEI